MPRLAVSPTKSNLLLLRRQLALGEEGYDLLDQKRQILLFELVHRLGPAIQAETAARAVAAEARELLRLALLEAGAAAIDRAAVTAPPGPGVRVSEQRLMGIRLPQAELVAPANTSTGASDDFTTGERWEHVTAARARFQELLPLLVRLAGRATAVLRLAHELRRAQRRCNALSKIYLPDRREAVAAIASTLEERERESIAILKLVRDRSRRLAGQR